MSRPMDLQHIRLISTSDLDKSEFQRVFDLRQALDVALDPDRPPRGREEWRRLLAHDAAYHSIHRRVVAFQAESALGMGHIDCTLDPNNLNAASLEIELLSHDDGLAAIVLDALVRIAERHGRTSIMAWGQKTVDYTGFWQKIGVPLRYTEQVSSLDLAAVDGLLMAGWIADSLSRAPDVTTVGWSGRCPKRWMRAFLTVCNAMNDAPSDDLEGAPVIINAEDMRGEEDAREEVGERLIVLLAVDARGAPVGTTQVMHNVHRPAASWQWDTVVLPRFRRRGIGRRLKAEMWRKLRAETPAITHLQTGSAASNHGMGAINADMGFRATLVNGAWQAHIDVLRDGVRRLGLRDVSGGADPRRSR